MQGQVTCSLWADVRRRRGIRYLLKYAPVSLTTDQHVTNAMHSEEGNGYGYGCVVDGISHSML